MKSSDYKFSYKNGNFSDTDNITSEYRHICGVVTTEGIWFKTSVSVETGKKGVMFLSWSDIRGTWKNNPERNK